MAEIVCNVQVSFYNKINNLILPKSKNMLSIKIKQIHSLESKQWTSRKQKIELQYTHILACMHIKNVDHHIHIYIYIEHLYSSITK